MSNSRRIAAIGVVLFLICSRLSGEAQKLSFKFVVRSQRQKEGTFIVNERRVEWDANQTAVVICDMWDKHWCEGATRRGGEIAPRINELAKAVRARGGFIVHAPSDCMKFYEGTPQREL